MWNPTHASGASGGGGGGVTDHGALTGLLDDDHTQYALWAAIQAAQLCNEVMNFPSLEGADDALPEWWENGALAALTEVDIAGEAGITETWERGLKVATSAAAAYSYQRYTYADQPRIKSGRSLSAIFAVWAVAGDTARLRLITSGGTTVVSANTTAAGWTILKAENLTLDGTYVDIRMEVDDGTAYFVPLGINVGAKAIPLRPRGLRHRNAGINKAVLRSLSGSTGDVGFADRDVSAATSNLAVYAQLRVNMAENGTTDAFTYCARCNGSTDTGGATELASGLKLYSNTDKIEWTQWLDDQQIYEEYLQRTAGSGGLDYGDLILIGWYEWE